MVFLFHRHLELLLSIREERVDRDKPGRSDFSTIPPSISIFHSNRTRLTSNTNTSDFQFTNRLAEGLGLSSPPSYAHTMNSGWPSQPHAPAYSPSDSTHGPAFTSPLGTASWGHDGFTHDPGFLASQEELRCMLFTIAQSAAPTRAGSPDGQGQGAEEPPRERGRLPMRPALSNGRRVEHLKNYVGQVAPWVSSTLN